MVSTGMLRKTDIIKILTELLVNKMSTVPNRDMPYSVIADNQSNQLDQSPFDLESIHLIDFASLVADFFQLRRLGIEDYLLRRRSIVDWATLIYDHALEGQAAIEFSTSGSTGEPKASVQQLHHLLTEHLSLLAMFDGVRRIRLFIPSYKIYGFIWGPLLAARLKVPLLLSIDAAEPVKTGDLIVAVPTLWQYYEKSIEHWPKNVFGLTSGACVPQKLAQKLSRYTNLCLVEVYGSSETGGIGYRSIKNGSYQLFDHLDKNPDSGKIHRVNDGRALPIQDEVKFVSDREFCLGGRLDRQIQINGHNVSLNHIRSTLEKSEAVKTARVRPTPNNEAISVLIVPKSKSQDQDKLVKHLRALAKSNLTPYERPAFYHLAEAVPTNHLGKEVSWMTSVNQ